MHLSRLLVALLALAPGLPAFAQPIANPGPEAVQARSQAAAIVVSNRADAKYDSKVAALEDLLSARLADLGFSLISRELVTGNLRAFAPPSASTEAESAAATRAAEAAFLDQSSALRLAQSLGADFLLHASITSYGETKRQVAAYGNTLTNQDYTLRVAYKVLDARAGGALTGDVVEATRTEQASANSSASIGGLFDDLLADTSRQIADSLRPRIAAGRIVANTAVARTVTVTLNIETADLYIPDVRVGNDNVVTVGEAKLQVTPLAATVEVDGIAVGTAPGKLTLKPGFSRLRVSREGWESWERTINAVDGQMLNIALTMSPDGLARFKATTAFLDELRNGAKLTDAEVRVLEGEAKSLENSFFRVDTKENFRFILPDRYQELETSPAK